MKEKTKEELQKEIDKLLNDNWNLANENSKYIYQIKCLLETIKILQER